MPDISLGKLLLLLPSFGEVWILWDVDMDRVVSGYGQLAVT